METFDCFPIGESDVSPETLRKIDETVEMALRIARKKADDLCLNSDDGKVLFIYTLQQLLVLVFMEKPKEVQDAVDFLRSRLKRDIRVKSAERLLN